MRKRKYEEEIRINNKKKRMHLLKTNDLKIKTSSTFPIKKEFTITLIF